MNKNECYVKIIFSNGDIKKYTCTVNKKEQSVLINYNDYNVDINIECAFLYTKGNIKPLYSKNSKLLFGNIKMFWEEY